MSAWIHCSARMAAVALAVAVLAGCPETKPEPEDSLKEVAGALAAGYAELDVDGTPGLTREEAAAGAPGMTDAQFEQMDANSDGVLVLAEINAFVSTSGAEGEAESEGEASQAHCSFSIYPLVETVDAAGDTVSITVSTADDCTWGVFTDAAWVTLGAAEGMGSGSVAYSVSANTGPQRIAEVVVAGRAHRVTQENGCAYTLAPETATVPAAGTDGAVALDCGAGCAWTASTRSSWIQLDLAEGVGPAQIGFHVAPNSGAARAGEIKVAGQVCAVIQESGCAFEVAMTELVTHIPAEACALSVPVSAGPGCVWAAESHTPWLELDIGGGTGPGTVMVTAQRNTSPTRTGTITVAGWEIAYTQEGGCAYELWAPALTLAAEALNASVHLYAGPDCPWEATLSEDWLRVDGPTFGAGDQVLDIRMDANFGLERSAVLQAGGQELELVQENGCAPELRPGTTTVPPEGGVVEFTVTAWGGCPWSVAAEADWVRVVSAAEGTGPGTVRVDVEPLALPEFRSCVVALAESACVVQQQPDQVFVDTLDDIADGDTGSLQALSANPGPDGCISLREALLVANSRPVPMLIGFRVSGSIHVDTPFPPLTGGGAATRIQGRGVIILEGPGATAVEAGKNGSFDGLLIQSGNNRIEGLAFVGFPGYGVRISGADARGNEVKACAVGIADGVPGPNGLGGILIENGARGTKVGEESGREVNEIAWNNGPGVAIGGVEMPLTGNLILSNSIHDNAGKGIEYVCGVPPVAPVELLDVSPCYAVAPDDGNDYRIELYADAGDEGRTLIDYAVLAGEDREFSLTVANQEYPDMNFTLLTHNIMQSTTSEFSAPVTAYMPPCLLQDRAYDVVRAGWVIVDTNGDGMLSQAEALAVYDVPVDVSYFFHHSDANGDSLVDMEEAGLLFIYAREAVNLVDEDRDGVFSRVELARYLDETQLAIADPDGDGAMTCVDLDILIEQFYGDGSGACTLLSRPGEWTRLLWDVADTDRNRDISFAEVLAVVHDPGLAEIFFADVDMDESGVCEFGEWPLAISVLQFATPAVDTDQNGILTYEEVDYWLTEELFGLADLDGSGVIDCNDLDLHQQVKK